MLQKNKRKRPIRAIESFHIHRISVSVSYKIPPPMCKLLIFNTLCFGDIIGNLLAYIQFVTKLMIF